MLSLLFKIKIFVFRDFGRWFKRRNFVWNLAEFSDILCLNMIKLGSVGGRKKVNSAILTHWYREKQKKFNAVYFIFIALVLVEICLNETNFLRSRCSNQIAFNDHARRNNYDILFKFVVVYNKCKKQDCNVFIL